MLLFFLHLGKRVFASIHNALPSSFVLPVAIGVTAVSNLRVVVAAEMEESI